VVDPALKKFAPAIPYQRGSWGPSQAVTLIAADGGWFNPDFVVAKTD
jgi:glucose-6-phosphate 1-dehydrogenase